MIADLDIIIPCYNAKKTVFDTLNSISIQKDIQGFKVYLVNDKSDYDYQEEVEQFSKFFYIEEIKLDKNLGPGGARREGINRTHSKYIMFIDSDDILFDDSSLKLLYLNTIYYDLCVSDFILQRDNIEIIKKNDNTWLHGKMYRRGFLEKYNINFNDSRANEDNGFNRLILLMNPEKNYLERVTYIYKENPDSITRRNNRSYKIFGLEGFVYNIKWAIEEAIKRGADTEYIPLLAASVLISMYYDYLVYIDDKDVDNIIKYSKDILQYYDREKVLDQHFNELCMRKELLLMNEGKIVKNVITFEEFLQKVEA